MSMIVTSMLFLLSSTATTVYEPTDSLKQQDYNYFMQKSKNQRTAASILIISGIVAGSATLTSALLIALGDGFTSLITLGASEPEKHSYIVPALLVLSLQWEGLFYILQLQEING